MLATDYIYGRIIEFGGFWDTIWNLVVFVGEIFQVFLWSELRYNNLGN